MVFIYRAIGNPIAALGGGDLQTSIVASAAGDFSYVFPVDMSAVTMIACDTSYNCSEMSETVVNTHKYIFLPVVIR